MADFIGTAGGFQRETATCGKWGLQSDPVLVPAARGHPASHGFVTEK